jgi:D-alanyl-D-alanine-carboxypeptidase/D-alanyl-D-alanine-endopeptidase
MILAACNQAQKPAPTPPPPSPAVPVDATLSAMYAVTTSPGMVVAVVRGDDVTIRGFGQRAPGDPRAPDGATLVRLESISKLFASSLAVNLAAEGKLTLNDPLQLYAPKGVRVPVAKGARPIELIDLATHTSGLPRVAPIDPSAPAGEAEADRWAWLAHRRPPPPPALNALYSNIAFDLLGDAEAAAAKTPYAAALAARITGPAGMADTTPSPTNGQCARMMLAEKVRPCGDASSTAASGGLYSTAADMAAWMKRQMPAGNPGPDIIAAQRIYYQRADLASVSGLDHAGPASGIGLAWIELPATATHPRLLEKTGGGDGFMTYIVIDPVHRNGVFLAVDIEGHVRLEGLAAGANDLVGALGAGS